MQVLGADGLLYQSIDDLFAVGREQNPSIGEFEASCFTGAHQYDVWSVCFITFPGMSLHSSRAACYLYHPPLLIDP